MPASVPAVSRRAFLGAGVAAAVAACGGTQHRRRRRRRHAPPVATQEFVSRPDLRPPQVLVSRRPPNPRHESFVFTECHGGNCQQGPLIIDRSGELVWFKPVSAHGSTGRRVFNVRVQSYHGEPVLTWWEGRIVGAHGQGHYEIYDQRYRRIGAVQAGNGYLGDLHEFRLTDEGTALLTSYGQTSGLIPRHRGSGLRRGIYLYGIVQEVDVATGEVLMQWRSDEHVPVQASMHLPPPADPRVPWDYFHVNSVAVDPADGNLLVSARNTWACYKLHRRTGEVMWTLGGRLSGFVSDDGARFAFQHHAIPHGDGMVTIFDNEAGPPDQARQSRGVVLSLDRETGRAELVREYLHDPPVLSAALGSVQALEGGGAFVGWGDSSYFTEYDASGVAILDARLASGVVSYRAFQDPWRGQPDHVPRIAARRRGSSADVYASWNGATVHRAWRVLGGPDRGSVRRVIASGPVTGFETRIAVGGPPAWLAAEALDGDGAPLARSEPVRLV